MNGRDRKKEIIDRLKSVEGHIRGVQRMVEEDKYCIDLLKQTLAVQGAIDKLNALILERHLEGCVTTAMRSEDPRERARVIGELLPLFQGGTSLAWNRQLAELAEMPDNAIRRD